MSRGNISSSGCRELHLSDNELTLLGKSICLVCNSRSRSMERQNDTTYLPSGTSTTSSSCLCVSCASCYFFIVRLHEIGMTCGTGLENMVTSSAQAMRCNSMAGCLYYVTMSSISPRMNLQNIAQGHDLSNEHPQRPISISPPTSSSNSQAQIIFPLSSLPPRSLLLTPSFDTVFPTPSPSPP